VSNAQVYQNRLGLVRREPLQTVAAQRDGPSGHARYVIADRATARWFVATSGRVQSRGRPE
jgi:hypothetical protein